MATNDIIVLESILKQKKTQTASSLSDSQFFEVFTFEQTLKKYDLSHDELLFGRIGGGDDGGIDGFFTFINEQLLDEDTDIETFKKKPLMELYLIQSKQSKSFSETAVDHIIATVNDIFDLEKDIKTLQQFYNESLVDKVNVFRKYYIGLASRHPELEINCIFANKGEVIDIHPKVINKSDTLKTTICDKFTGAKASVKFIGARDLLDASRKEKSYTLQLQFLENYISRGANNYVVLTSLIDYYDFITDENGNLSKYIFESNVRDYQGDVEVNMDIRQTLESNGKLDFWLLNNGITIIASKASIVGKTITLDDVQVVNGLQTTTTIHDHLKTNSDIEKESYKRAILIKIIVATNSEDRDRIIKATNFQTRIPDASLRATDRIQRDIEDYFLRHEWFYDRRKNYYKNTGKPVDRIISIPYLAQAVMAIVLREPNNSRARPSSLIKRDSDYSRVFSEHYNLDIYLFCAKMMKSIDMFIRSTVSVHTWQEKSNLRFHLAMLLMVNLLGDINYHPSSILTIIGVDLEQELINDVMSRLIDFIREYNSGKLLSIDTIAKSKEFVAFVLEKMNLSVNMDK